MHSMYIMLSSQAYLESMIILLLLMTVKCTDAYFLCLMPMDINVRAKKHYVHFV